MCRTANGWDVNWEEDWKNAVIDAIETGNVNYQSLESARQKDGRGNICPTTIIMPTLAMQCKDKLDRNLKKTGLALTKTNYEKALVEEFIKLLDKKIHEAKDSLIDRFDWISSQPASSAKFMYENGTMYGYRPEEGIKSALKHGTLAIGQLGLAETLQILIGEDHSVQPKKVVPKKSDIVNSMIAKIEAKENRKLTDDEIQEIKNYVSSKG